MTVEDADKLSEQIGGLNFDQIRLLWRWLTLEMGRRIHGGRYDA